MSNNNSYKIRLATADDAEALLNIYRYYVEKTAITYEYEVPTVSEFKSRIEKVLEDFPYLVVEEVSSGNDTENTGNTRIVGYAYASKFHERAAYQWCVEMSIYLDKDCKRNGLGRALYEELEKRLKDMGILNLYSCIGYPEKEDEYLNYDSVRFHEKMGYKLIGHFHKCGFKFGKWYDMVWMEKIIGEHGDAPCIINYQHS